MKEVKTFKYVGPVRLGGDLVHNHATDQPFSLTVNGVEIVNPAHGLKEVTLKFTADDHPVVEFKSREDLTVLTKLLAKNYYSEEN